MAATDPVTPLLGNRAPESSPSNPGPASHVQPRPVMSPAQLLADNISTRMRELGAFTALTVMVVTGHLAALYAAGIIAAIVLPIEITRQLVKPAVAKITGATGPLAAIAGVVALHKLLTYGAIAGAVAAGVAGCGGTGPAMRTSPVLGYYTSPDWGKCAVGGVRVESAGSVTVTAHGCVRLDGMDASVAPISGFTPLGGTHDPFTAGDAGARAGDASTAQELQPIAIYPTGVTTAPAPSAAPRLSAGGQ